MYCEGTIRRKAYEIGYQVEKGFQHWQGEFVYHDSYGDRYSGYMVKNLYTGFYEWGCYDSNFDHLWDLNDVAEFLKGEYETRGLAW